MNRHGHGRPGITDTLSCRVCWVKWVGEINQSVDLSIYQLINRLINLIIDNQPKEHVLQSSISQSNNNASKLAPSFMVSL